ncbi:peptide chain release factor 1 [Candidatus Woesearchaeota archaeon CG08_land_8_20_14_0_20_47_9]|nr:MAG: peptide chain release factor 1 [Candidatus Woesearchaeota archaeon CG08_land_8_20_14_0_20_47_9]
MVITAVQRFKLKGFIEELSNYRGRHTELVSVYVPSGYDLNKITSHLAQEQGTATNIKSTSTRKNVIDALEKMLQHLKLFKQTPEHGLAAFSGNVAEREGMSDVRVWSVEPPVPLKTRIYRCDKAFVLEPLQEMLETRDVYGLVVMDRREGNISLLKGKSIIPLAKSTSNVPGKTRAGGQSSQRYARIREGAAKEFYSRLGEHMKEEFINNREIKGIIVGGPGPTKYDFVNGNYITNEVKKKIIGIKDISYTGDFGLNELVDISQDILANEEITAEKQIVNRFLETLAKNPGMAAYGEAHVRAVLSMGAVETLLLSEGINPKVLKELEEEAERTGSCVEIISVETKEGAQLRDIGGIAAILRYEVSQ